MEWTLAVWVGVGGFFGTVARYGMSLWTPAWAVLIVNVLGSFGIGWVIGTNRLTSTEVTVLAVGALGGFTTYSAFSAETAALLREGRWGATALYIFAMLTLGLAATFAGLFAAKWI